MDPIADTLLIVAALIALVSLNRLDALGGDGDHRPRVRSHGPALRGRYAAGRIISASIFGELKTAFQVAMVMVLIAVDGRPAWVDALIYVTVLVTMLSGADYFFGVWSRLRRRVEPGPPARVNH